MIQFVHVNLVAHNWRRLARFYQDVFRCVPVPPERDLSGHSPRCLSTLVFSSTMRASGRQPGFGEGMHRSARAEGIR